MSRGCGDRPNTTHISDLWKYGIGKEWYNRYGREADKDFLTLDHGKLFTVPKYYDYLLEKDDPDKLEAKKAKRKKHAAALAHDNTWERLLVKEKIKIAQSNLLKREDY
jgi:hypothetical protein